ncbi:MAG: VWA domain-containing protein, partial [Planctomycetota bacterium]|nr:VWA domain-containing protein [Planctomycetota bacterium]
MGLDALRRYAVRLGIVALAAAALADFRPVGGPGERLPIALVDVSRSVGPVPERLPEGLRAASHWVVFADGVSEIVGGAEAPRLPRGLSRVEAALRHAEAKYQGFDLILVTDGRGIDDAAVEAAGRIRTGGGRVFTVPPETMPAEVGLEEARLIAGWPAPVVRAVVGGSTSGSAEVRLVLGSRVADRRLLTLQPGTTQVVELRDSEPPAEGGTYRIVLAATPGTPDDDSDDDVLAVGLRPESRVLLAWGIPEAGVLTSAGGPAIEIAREPDPAALAGADVVVLGNVPWGELGTETVRALETFVAGGGRLLLFGGPDAYAGGGWAGTPLETRLAPLRVPRQEGTGLALVLALDRSGSTDGTRLAHLKESARRVVQGLAPGERLGVLPFAGRPAEALLEPGVVGLEDDARTVLLAAIDALEAAGDTDLPAAILAAGRRVQGIEARERRVLLLTDGDPEHPPEAETLGEVGAWLMEHDIRFGAFVVDDAEAARRLARYVATSPEDVVLISDLARLPDRLVHALGARRHRLEVLPAPTEVRYAPDADGLAAFEPAALHALEVLTGAGVRVLATAHRGGPDPYDVPFAAVRTVGAGQVIGVAWGPALQRDRDLRTTRLAAFAPWVARLAAAADRGLVADYEAEALVVRWPERAGDGRIHAQGEGAAGELYEASPGIFRGPVPSGAESGVRVHAADGTTRPLRLPARPGVEQRGSGVDEGAL